MLDSFMVIAFFVLLTVIVGATTQWIVHKINPPKPNQPKPEGIVKSVGKTSPIAFVMITIFNIWLVSTHGGVAFALIATGPAMIVLGIMSIVYFVSPKK